jgi:tetratricopeptide (TPR) repeat protein
MAYAAPIIMAASLLATAPGSKQEAEARVADADRLYDAGDYQGALERLRQAQALYPSPRLQFNFGLTFRSMGRDREALEAFERFLAETGDGDAAIADRRAEAARHVTELRGRLAAVTVAPRPEVVQTHLDVAPEPPPPSRTPVYRRWWFWTVAATLAGAAAVGVLAARGGGRPSCDGCVVVFEIGQ